MRHYWESMKQKEIRMEVLLIVGTLNRFYKYIIMLFQISYFSSSSDLFCCSAVANTSAPVEVRALYLRLQWRMYRSELAYLSWMLARCITGQINYT